MSRAVDTKAIVLRRDCRWFLRYAGHPFCRREAFKNPQAAMERLDLGCSCDSDVEYCPIDEKANATADPNESGDPPWKLVEWEDSG